MRISSRSRKIFELLLASTQDLTAARIASEIHVSARTVHRELAILESFLQNHGVSLLKKSGSGIRLQGEKAALEKLAQLISVSEDIEFSPEERQLYLSCLLLESEEPIKLFTLSHEIRVTVATVSNDLDELESWVQKFGVTLIRRRGYGVELAGEEEQLREMIRQVIKLRFDDTELISSRDEQPLHLLDRRLLLLAGQSKMEAIEQVLWRWEEEWGGRLGENAYTELLIRISIALQRIRNGKMVRLQDHDQKDKQLPLKFAAVYLAELLTEQIGIVFSFSETAYLSRLLRSAQAIDFQLPANDLALTDKVRSLIEDVQHALGVEFKEDHSLRDGLSSHLKDALQRLYEGGKIRNPLLDQIKNDYAQLFEIVGKAANHVFQDIVVPDEEIGFLVMHFGASLERLKQLQHDVRAIVVCSNGIGSSKLLHIRLQKEFSQIQIVGRVSWYEASRLEKDSYDLIISTVDLPLDQDQYIKVSPLLTAQEVEQVRLFIQTKVERKGAVDVAEHEKKQPDASTFAQIVSLKTTINEMVSLIERFEVVQIQEQRQELSVILQEACKHEEGKEVLLDAGRVVERIIRREQSGSQLIPGTAVALFHTRGQEITRPSLTLYRLPKASKLDVAPHSNLSHFLLMLAPQTLAKEVLEVLSEISAMLLDDEMIKLLELGEETSIRDYLTKHLKTLIKTKSE